MYIVDFNVPVVKLEKCNYNINDLSKSINTSIEDIMHKPNWYKIDNEWYYFKSINKLEKFINEILGSFLAKKCNLETATFKVASLNNGKLKTYGLISKNFKLQDKSYVTTFDLKLPLYDQKLSNLVTIKEYFKNDEDYKKFIISILKATAIDFYMNQIDRVNENLLFIKNEDSIELAPLFDYSLAMDIGTQKIQFKTNNEIEKKRYGSAFLEMTFPSEEMKLLFKEYPEFYETIKSFLEFDINDFFKEVEREYPLAVPSKLKEYYKKYDENKKNFIKTLI